MSDAKATQPVTATERTRVNFGKIPEVMELPNLISVQKESFDRFMTDGLREAFKESSPIQSQNHILESPLVSTSSTPRTPGRSAARRI